MKIKIGDIVLISAVGSYIKKYPKITKVVRFDDGSYGNGFHIENKLNHGGIFTYFNFNNNLNGGAKYQIVKNLHKLLWNVK